MNKRVTVVGSFMVDLIAYTNRFPANGETIFGEKFHLGPGGKGHNQAVAAAKLGANTDMVGIVGEDVFGDMFIENLKKENIGSEFVFRNKSMTGTAQINVIKDGSNSIIIVPGANSHLTKENVRKAKNLLAETDILVLQLEIPVETALEATKLINKSKSLVILNPAPFIENIDEKLLENTDILVPNEVEFEKLFKINISDIDKNLSKIRKELKKYDIRYLIITIGKNGARLISENDYSNYKAVTKNIHTIDTTGAGDSFVGALGYCLSSNKNIYESIDFANICAGLSTAKAGTSTSYPEKGEVDKYLSVSGNC